MKFLVILGLCITCVVAELSCEKLEKIRLLKKHCQEKAGITTIVKEDIDKLRNGEDPSDLAKVKTYNLCIMQQNGAMKDSGDIDVDKIKGILERQKVRAEQISRIESLCFGKKDNDEDTALEAAKCIFKHHKGFSFGD